MAPDARVDSGEGHEIVEVIGEPGAPSVTMRLVDFIPIYIPTVERGALSQSRRKRRFLDFLRAHPSRDWFLRSTFVGRLRRRSQATSGADEGDSDGGGGRRPWRRFRVPFVRKIKWGKLWNYAVSCPVVAGLYAAYSPLGRKQAGESDSESSTSAGVSAQHGGNRAAENYREVEIKIYNRRVVVSSPEWSGGLFDCCDDGTACALSATCTFCVFGWNMERLGFGNMYVHAFTFILLCVAPFLIFSVTALNVHDDDIRNTVVSVGVLLGVCGFLYGGFWRTQMRKRYKLPASGCCCWCCCGGGRFSAAVSDCTKWLFCWSCALAQEVRTANFYDVEDDRFLFHGARNEEGRAVLVPLPREATTYSRSMSCPPKIDAVEALTSGASPLDVQMAAVGMERSATYSGDHHTVMRPPVPPRQMDKE
ncbi:hypothetical protein ABZP36_005642 [Zizania latifolia]